VACPDAHYRPARASVPAVTQASYQAPPSCESAATTYSPPAIAQPQPATPAPQPSAPPTPEQRPTLDPTPQPQAQNSTSKFPVENTSKPPQQPAQPASSHPEYDVKKKDNSTFLEAPKLFSPQDRTAQRNIAPVHNALYTQPASYRQVSTAKTVVTAEQAHKDAIGWSSASK